MYGELGEPDRDRVELHLERCEPCTGKFAEISFARLDVYEWQRDEFAAMETPRIVVPYRNTVEIAGWFDPIKAFFASSGRWTLPAAGFAAAVIIFTGWMMSSGPVDVAVSNSPEQPEQVEAAPARAADLAPVSAKSDSTERPDEQPAVVGLGERRDRVRARPVSKQPSRSATAERRQNKPAARVPGSAPRLNNFDEEEDNTLRLGDLLAEIDTSE